MSIESSQYLQQALGRWEGYSAINYEDEPVDENGVYFVLEAVEAAIKADTSDLYARAAQMYLVDFMGANVEAQEMGDDLLALNPADNRIVELIRSVKAGKVSRSSNPLLWS